MTDIPEEKPKNRAKRRKNDWKKAIRKKKLIHFYSIGDWYKHLHQYSKGKIHCSCSLCKPKVSKRRPAFGEEKGRHGGHWWRHTDVKRFLAMTYREKEYKNELVINAS